jgi:hypothetical protein
MQWALSAELQDYGRLGLAFNRCSFALALVLGIAGWIYIGSRRVATRFSTACRDQLRRSLAIAVAAACPLIASVIADAVLTGLRLLTAQSLASASVPLLLMGAELILAAFLVAEICKTMRRAGRVSSLLSR